MVQVGINQAAVELPEANNGLVSMFVAGAPNGIQDAYGGQESDCLAGRSQQLLDSLCVIAGFAEHLVVKHGQLVCTDNEGISGIDRNCFRFIARKVPGELSRSQAIVIAFVDLRIHGFVSVEDAIEQATTVR